MQVKAGETFPTSEMFKAETTAPVCENRADNIKKLPLESVNVIFQLPEGSIKCLDDALDGLIQRFDCALNGIGCVIWHKAP